MGIVGFLSDTLNTREDALRLMITILAGYPLAFIHRTFFANKPAVTQHIFIVAAGISLYLFNCGLAIYHSVFSTIMVFLITNFMAGTNASVVAAHVVFLGHILAGYWFAETASYDITWTTPFCIMTLRYIGLVMDVYDGVHFESLKPDQQLTAIRNAPGILEVFAYGFMYTGTFVGPQFTLARFRSFINGEYLNEKKEVRDSGLMPSLGRFVAGVTYLVLNQWGAVWIPNEYFNSQAFNDLPFFWRWTWVMLWFRFTMMRYCSAWLLTEGAAILNGLGYNGKDKNGDDRWDGVRDLHITGWELGLDYTSCVTSFNCGTNTFAKNHIFRRLRGLGSKMAAQAVTLFYLAVWHGYHLGYFMLFGYEFMCMVAQEQFYAVLARMPEGVRNVIAQPWFYPVKLIFGRLVLSYSMGFTFLTFGLIKKEIWIGPIKSLYFVGYFIFFLILPVTFTVLLNVLPKPKVEKKVGEKAVTPNGAEAKKEL